MINADQLRLAAAIVHAVPGAELRVCCGDRDCLVVSRHPAADLVPCAFRQLIIESTRRRPERRAPEGGSLLMVDDLRLGGALHDLGGGVFASVGPEGRPCRWLATTLSWKVVADRVSACPDPAQSDHERPAEDVVATVAPDRELGVTLLRLDSASSIAVSDLDRIAAALSAAVLVEELVAAVRCTPTDAEA